ncbi:pyridoxal phosphate-dependent aminotransferase, partial [Myxococcota bacterium]|nr:pyridoxal phosphate-dependent aminotransferase [Myxococcota bacterium]MBU1900061.1 pyridoxal phosphate-dependent aminotransferase [Myxococcota bacterium]
MKFSAYLDAIPASVYSKLGAIASRAPKVYPLHVGDTYRQPPQGCHLKDLNEEALPGLHRYGPVEGIPALRQIIEETRQGQLGAFGPEHLLITGGATPGLSAAVAALVNPGDEVLLSSPHWPLIAGAVRVVGGRVIEVPLYGVAHSAAEAVAAFEAARGPRAVAIYLNTPSNPTGRLAPRAWLEAIVAFARQHDLWILSDEVYEDYAWGGEHVYTRPLAPERTISAHSFSKAYGMAGNRCGYLVGPAEAIAQIRKVTIHSLYDAPTGGQWAAARALAGPGPAWA